MNSSHQTALFGLGNFWEPEYEFAKLPGVLHAEAGYTGGTSSNPNYHDIGDHSEAVQITFDPHRVSYEELLGKFWRLHDPTAQYEPKFRSTIFYFDEAQRAQAQASKNAAQHEHDDPIVTQLAPAGKFYAAENYNQDYLARLRGEI